MSPTKRVVTKRAQRIDTTQNSSQSDYTLANSRLEEKEELGSLNNRLANYIERVRQLEKENKMLDLRIKQVETMEGTERQKMIDSYTRELSDLRKALDDLARSKAQAVMDCDRFQSENKDLRKAQDAVERQLDDLQSRLASEETAAIEYQKRANGLDSENKKLATENKKMKGELAELRAKESNAKKQLEEETLLRSDAENRLQSAEDQLKFLKEMHARELSEMKQRRETEVDLRSQHIEDEYQSQLQAHLDQTRLVLNDQLAEQRRVLESKYEDKIRASQARSTYLEEERRKDRDESSSWRTRLETAERDRKALQAEIDGLIRERDRAQEALASVRKEFEDRLSYRDDEIRRLHDQLRDTEAQYAELMDIKIQLDQELANYRALLEDEETRLNISSNKTSTMITTASGAKKRRRGGGADEGIDIASAMQDSMWDRHQSRNETTEFTDQNIGISVIEHTADYVKLRNSRTMDIGLQGFKLRQKGIAGEVEFKFTARHTIPDKDEITVWSKDAEGAHSKLPHHMKLKSYSWLGGENVRTALVNDEDKEVAWLETRNLSMRDVVRGEDGKQQCSLM